MLLKIVCEFRIRLQRATVMHMALQPGTMVIISECCVSTPTHMSDMSGQLDNRRGRRETQLGQT